VCTLAHVFEEAGLATIVLTPMRDVADRMKVPRALYTKFPVGLSLGKPRDKDFQNEVLHAAFSLLEESMGPVIREFPLEVSSTGHTPLVCTIPPRHDAEIHPAVDEAQALKFAYDRALKKSNRTSVGMQIEAELVPEALESFVRIVEGEQWDEVGLIPGTIYGTVHDIRSYYEELACELAKGPIEPWGTEEWFYDQTEAGQLILKARQMMRDNGADQSIWFGLAPAGRK
tara:strand:+ start:203 stop:889 length:687 start_codon:yes stop_codon:yes gene_type:complete